jgi:hypothetical protein
MHTKAMLRIARCGPCILLMHCWLLQLCKIDRVHCQTSSTSVQDYFTSDHKMVKRREINGENMAQFL